MLTLVRPSPEGQEGGSLPSKPRRKVPVLSLLPAERARLRALLKTLRRAYGTWACLAEVMGVRRVTLKMIAGGHCAGSPGTLLRAARAANTTIDRILAPLSSADVCPTCGQRKGGA